MNVFKNGNVEQNDMSTIGIACMQDRFHNLRFQPLLLGESNPSDGVLLIEAVLSSLVRGCRVDGDIFLVEPSDTRLLPHITT